MEPASREFIEKNLLPKARQLIDTLTAEYKAGRVGFQTMIPWHRKIMELERRIADTEAKKIALLESHRAMLQQWHRMAKTQYRVGRTSQAEVLKAEYELATMDLRLLEENESSFSDLP